MDISLPAKYRDDYPALVRLFERQIAATPRHAGALTKRLSNAAADHLRMADEIAEFVWHIAGADLERVLLDYDWICQLVLGEELHFRRSGNYRLSRFEDAVAEVYSNDDLMAHYMNGLLITQVWWSNHTEIMRFFRSAFLRGFTKPFRHLEIGPGHGLLMLLAGRETLCESLEGWDISARSIDHTRRSLDLIGIQRATTLRVQDLYTAGATGRTYDSIVLSEILEHLEQPRAALQAVSGLLAEAGRLFVNMPVNSPAPDHLFLLRTPEDVVDFVADSGYVIEDAKFAPQTNMTLEAARRTQSTISTAVIARRRA
ncbi:MAG: class I SAM-dependent methyltransferase [Gammaproteobacteria bacterium]